MSPDDFDALRRCRDRIIAVLADGEMTRTQLVRRCSAHPSDRFRTALDMMQSDGRVAVRLHGVGRRATTLVRLAEPKAVENDPLLIRMTTEAARAQHDAVQRLNGWFNRLDAEKTNTILWSARKPMLLAARDILVTMHRQPWLFGHDVRVWEVMEDAQERYGLARARKALRHLSEMDAVVLTERRGRSRPSTVRLAHIPPYPMG